MPTYGYKCIKCNHEFEILQKISDEPIRECEKCGAEVKKLLYPVGIVFKGSGFHINDYRKPETSVDKGPKDTAPAADPVKPSVEKAAEKVESK